MLKKKKKWCSAAADTGHVDEIPPPLIIVGSVVFTLRHSYIDCPRIQL